MSRLTITRKGRWQVQGGTDHNSLEESFEEAGNLASATPGTIVAITPPTFEVTAKAGAAPPPAKEPEPDPTPDPPPTPEPAHIVSQELIPSKYQVMVGESFTVEGFLTMSEGPQRSVTAYRLGFDKAKLTQPLDGWTPVFTAIAVGEAKISNDNSGTTGRTSVTIVANDGTVFPKPEAPKAPTSPSTPTTPSNPGTGPIGPAGSPAPSALSLPVPVSPVGTGAHLARPEVEDALGRVWFAEAHVGDDPTARGLPAQFVNAAGDVHPMLMGTFYADGCHVHVARMDNAYDLTGCKLRMTYDGQPVAVPASSYPDGTYTFWKGCWMPMIRYGKQVEFADLLPIDWSVLPSYSADPQTPFNDSKRDYTWNGLGIASTPGMGTTGERGDIGYLMQAYTAFLRNPTAETWAVVRRGEDWAGNWSSVYNCEPATGQIIDFHAYLMATTLPPAQSAAWQVQNPIKGYGGTVNGDTITPPPSAWKGSGSPYIPNGAHLQSFGKLGAMLTGTAHDKDNLSFWANWTLLEINPNYTRAGGCALGAQRRFAWCLGTLLVAAYHSANTDYFRAEVMRNIAIADAFPKNDFGLYDPDVAYQGKGEAYKYKGLARWMQSYLAMTFDAVSNKIPEAIGFAQYLGKHEALCAQYPWYLARTIYTFICYGPDGKMLTDFKEMTKLSLCDNGYALEDAEAMVNAITVEEAYAARVANAARSNKAVSGKCVNGVADFLGNPASPDSYPAGAEAAVIAAANAGTPGIEKAVAYVQNLPTKPAYAGNQKYHLQLREAA